MSNCYDGNDLFVIWKSVEKLVRLWARKYITTTETRGYDLDDLMQAGFLAVCDTVVAHDPERGSFNTLLRFYVRRRFAETAGRRGTKQRPELNAISLDAPITDETDATLVGTLADETATGAFDAMREAWYTEQLHNALETCLAALPPIQLGVLRSRYFEGKTCKEVALLYGVDEPKARRIERAALTNMQRGRNRMTLEQFREDIISHSIQRCTYGVFRSTQYSAVEWATEKLLGYANGR